MAKSFGSFGLGGLLLLAALAASMMVLPLMLPPLPPPPLMLLLLPVGIMAALMFLAFSPTEAAGNVVVLEDGRPLMGGSAEVVDVHFDRDPINLGRKIKKLVVELVTVQAADDEIDEVIDESSTTLNFKPASKSSIQALKRVKFGNDEDSLLPLKKRRRREDMNSKKQCTICLDDFIDGEEIASMPCGHVYHDGCIVKWFETNHLCPLCRYEMPS
ncbi:E3 ubiquitin-protein ligase RING1-like [Durio zibethinus]|uniref:RING-type E3 ubiquitin transferase n=1 Tax=Durio zibethinus TaxID=66656 RepID=A0A6P6AHD0_DURZI|nr:E3 ubiquitin-protein ligase RING1-like [Durio zibethinus]